MQNISFLDLSASTGLVATVVLTFNFLFGMMLSTNYKRQAYWKKLPQKIKNINLFNFHNWTAYVALFLVVLHPTLLLFDASTKFKFIDIIFPINAPTQKIFVVLGTLSMFAIFTVVITSQKIVRDKMSFRTWKNIHLISYGTAMLFVIHGIVMDPLLKNRSVDIFDAEKLISELCLVAIIVATFYRVRYQRKLNSELRKFHLIKINNVIEETKDAKSFLLSIPDKLKKQFIYTAGQFIIIKLKIDGKEYKRSYSLSSCPFIDEKLQITVKRIKDGVVSNYLNNKIEKDNELLIFPPSGNFYKDSQQDERRNYILFAGGSGITPIYSIIKTQLNKFPRNYVKLIYANKDPDSIIFYQKLDTLKKLFPERFFLTHIVSETNAGWNGMTGRLDSGKIKLLLDEQPKFSTDNTEYYICGPSPFMELVEHELQNYGVPMDKVHSEKFISIGDGSQTIEIGKEPAEINLKESLVNATLDGKENKVTSKPDETILDALLFAGIDAPYSCKEGVCEMCMAKLIKGKVQIINSQSLTDLDIKENRILTCRAKCLTKDVEISYDGLSL